MLEIFNLTVNIWADLLIYQGGQAGVKMVENTARWPAPKRGRHRQNSGEIRGPRYPWLQED